MLKKLRATLLTVLPTVIYAHIDYDNEQNADPPFILYQEISKRPQNFRDDRPGYYQRTIQITLSTKKKDEALEEKLEKALLDKDYILQSGEVKLVPAGFAIYIENPNICAAIYPRSGLGFKNGIVLGNLTGIIDSDYYEADNEGHIIIAVANHGNKDMVIKQGERFAQGLFVRYYLADEDEVKTDRHGGFGSTN